ncbi:hypothetical protein HBZS_113100 [Helicobacter bizzozeronii CCUG 35545]|nr:hypothetical protein HBZS_113100 [Helicobacter bizzozeronii CCUG 35545]
MQRWSAYSNNAKQSTILHLKDLGILKEVASKHFELDFSMAKG